MYITHTFFRIVTSHLHTKDGIHTLMCLNLDRTTYSFLQWYIVSNIVPSDASHILRSDFGKETRESILSRVPRSDTPYSFASFRPRVYFEIYIYMYIYSHNYIGSIENLRIILFSSRKRATENGNND